MKTEMTTRRKSKIKLMTGATCLCGHNEWCAQCTPSLRKTKPKASRKSKAKTKFDPREAARTLDHIAMDSLKRQRDALLALAKTQEARLQFIRYKMTKLRSVENRTERAMILDQIRAQTAEMGEYETIIEKCEANTL